MRLSVVHKDKFSFTNSSGEILLEKDSQHVPAIGDLIKDGHSLSSFSVYRVEDRVFRSAPSRNGETVEFEQVFLLVSEVPGAT